jgi:hypothetical protein
MRRSLAPALALAVSALVLIGCASPTSAEPRSSATPASSSPTPSPTVEIDPQIVVSLDGIVVTDESGTRSAAFEDPAGLLDLLEDTTGELPEPEKVENFPGYDSAFVNYTWDGLRVFTDSALEGPASVAITGPSLSGVPIQTEEGLAVGSTRAELLDAGAWGIVDTEDPATAEYVGLGEREVPGTESLTHPGSVGILYTLFRLDGDTVTQINVPANDFSDV